MEEDTITHKGSYEIKGASRRAEAVGTTTIVAAGVGTSRVGYPVQRDKTEDLGRVSSKIKVWPTVRNAHAVIVKLSLWKGSFLHLPGYSLL